MKNEIKNIHIVLIIMNSYENDKFNNIFDSKSAQLNIASNLGNGVFPVDIAQRAISKHDDSTRSSQKGWLDTITSMLNRFRFSKADPCMESGVFQKNWFRFSSKHNIKIHPQKSMNHHDISDDITTYIRCIFHDFRGPLNNISLGTEILMSSISTESEEFSTAKTIKESCLFLSEALDGFLNVNISDGTKIHDLQLNYQPFNIVGLIKKIQYILLFNIMEKKIELKYNINPLQEWVLGDYKHIQHVLMNLLSNAIKFSDKKSSIEIKLEGQLLDNNKQRVLVSIIDNNPFIPLDIKTHLFEKYNTSNDRDGTGLGLYICKKIIETHGGSIHHFNNSKNNTHGNIFQVELYLDICAASYNQMISTKCKAPNRNSSNSMIHDPHLFKKPEIKQNDIVVEKSSDKIESDNKHSRMFLQHKMDSSVVVNLNSEKQNTKIMVIDDSDLTRKFMVKMIQQNYSEYKIYEAIDGLDALIKMINYNEAGKKFSMLLVDNVMPNLNGELLSKILRGMGYQGLIIGITGNGLQQDINQYIENGADYVFIKPFTKSNMAMLIDFVKKEGYESKEGKTIVEKNGVLTWS
jgi:signal transduction histidine kinase/CheY-like chemotaxis protein